jgi:hypothetical protein
MGNKWEFKKEKRGTIGGKKQKQQKNTKKENTWKTKGKIM